MGFVHPKAEVENARLGKNCWVSAFAAINGNEGAIEIGRSCSVQESCVLHGKGVRIGDNVTMGHGAIVHGARVGSNVLVGMHATILNGAKIGDWCVIGAGSLILENQEIPGGSVALGAPAKIIRGVSEADRKLIREAAEAYLKKLKEKGLFEE